MKGKGYYQCARVTEDEMRRQAEAYPESVAMMEWWRDMGQGHLLWVQVGVPNNIHVEAFALDTRGTPNVQFVTKDRHKMYRTNIFDPADGKPFYFAAEGMELDPWFLPEEKVPRIWHPLRFPAVMPDIPDPLDREEMI